MKKVVSIVISTSIMVLPFLALAQSYSAPTVDVMEALDSITNWMFTILLIVAVLFIILAGFYFITAQGDPDRVSKARYMVLWSLVGVAVAILAKGLVLLIQRAIG